MTTPEEVASTISSLIESSPNQKITGVELSVLVRHKFPGFVAESFGCRNLRGFIRTFVPAVTEVGRSGADVVYGVRRTPDTAKPNYNEARYTAMPPTASPPTIVPRQDTYISSAVWKTFVSPVSPFKLYVNKETGTFEVVPPGGESLQSPWVHIPSCSAEVHRQIARDFIVSLSDEQSRKALESTITQSGLWWQNYYTVIRQLQLDTRWNQYRRRRIVHELESSLTQHSVPLTGMRAVSSTRLTTTHALPAAPATATDISEESRLRSLAIDVVRNMQISELRELKVPLGHVIDALAAKRNPR